MLSNYVGIFLTECLLCVTFFGFFAVKYSYAKVSVTSEESLNMLLEKVPGWKLHGETIDCRLATLQNLSVFKEKASQREGNIRKVVLGG